MKPEDVFVPEAFPVETNNAYANRGDAQKLLEDSIKSASVPLVFGGYGVGKSTLVHYCTKSHSQSGNMVYIASAYKMTLRGVFENILEKIGYEVTTERAETSSTEVSSEIKGTASVGIWEILKAKLSGKIGRKRKKEARDKVEIVVKSPTDGKIIALAEERGLLLAIDELHRSTEEFTEDLSAFLKAYANSSCKRFRIVLLGTEHDPRKLVLSDPGIDRKLQEVKVSPMSEPEAEQVCMIGFPLLGIKIDQPLISKIAKTCTGSPFICQYLCLEIAKMAIATGQATDAMFDQALKNYGTRKAARMIATYKRSIETTGEKRYRKQILHAMANTDGDYVTMEQLTEKISHALGESVPSTAISGPLRDLKSPAFGNILRDHVDRSGRAFNYSLFDDPALKTVIRMIDALGLDCLE